MSPIENQEPYFGYFVLGWGLKLSPSVNKSVIGVGTSDQQMVSHPASRAKYTCSWEP